MQLLFLRPSHTELLLLLLLPLVHSFTLSPHWSITKVKDAPSVSGHTAAVDPKGRTILFGGLLPDRTATSTLNIRYPDGDWIKVDTAGGPGPRMYAAAAILGDTFWCFGGWDPEEKGSGGTFKDSVHTLDIETLAWAEQAPLPCGPVSRHTACTVGDRIVLHTYKDGGVVVVEADGAVTEQPTSGDAPSGLSMCACAALSETEMLVYGGSTKTQGMSADAYVLDCATWEWRKLRPAGPAPSARGSACACKIELGFGGADTCLVFGGAGLGSDGYAGGAGLQAHDETWLLSIEGSARDEAKWQRVETATSPEPRVAASLSALPGEQGYLLQGGWHPASGKTYDEPCVFRTGA